MATEIDWPEGLPGPGIESFRDEPTSNVVRFAPDVGPRKVRRRMTGRVRRCAFDMLLTTAQLDALETFFYETLAEALTFNWTHPRLGSIEVGFVEPFKITGVSGEMHRVSMNWEKLP